MKTVIAYEASDGSRFDSQSAAEAHEQLVSRVAHAMESLGPRPKLGNGRWKQHDGFACRLARRRVVMLYAAQNPDDAERWRLLEQVENIDPRTHVIGRMLDGDGPLARAWYRLSCINWETFREYDQPYYAMHPEEAGTEQAT